MEDNVSVWQSKQKRMKNAQSVQTLENRIKFLEFEEQRTKKRTEETKRKLEEYVENRRKY